MAQSRVQRCFTGHTKPSAWPRIIPQVLGTRYVLRRIQRQYLQGFAAKETQWRDMVADRSNALLPLPSRRRGRWYRTGGLNVLSVRVVAAIPHKPDRCSVAEYLSDYARSGIRNSPDSSRSRRIPRSAAQLRVAFRLLAQDRWAEKEPRGWHVLIPGTLRRHIQDRQMPAEDEAARDSNSRSEFPATAGENAAHHGLQFGL